MTLALVVWVGGIIFFSFVVAPALFTILPSRELAGAVVTRALSTLHWMGLVSGIVFALSSLLYSYETHGAAQPFALRHLLIYAMLALTAASQFGISPKMHALRAEMGTIDNVAPADARRLEFDRLHEWSVRLEGGVLLCGLGLVALTSRHLS